MAGEIQAVLFDKKAWTPAAARVWLRAHNMEGMKEVHTTEHYHRYRIHDPKKYVRLRIGRKNKEHIAFIFGFAD